MEARVFYYDFLEQFEGHYQENGIKQITSSTFSGAILVTITYKTKKQKERYYLFDALSRILVKEGVGAKDMFKSLKVE